MKTRPYRMILAGIITSFLVANSGCNKNSSTGPGASQAIGHGIDYLPLSGSQTLSGKVTYQQVLYDSTGKILESHAATDQDVHGYIGLPVFVGGIQGYPLYGYATDGKTLVPSNVVVAQDSQAVILFGQPGKVVVLLPKNVSVGARWVANPFSAPDSQVTMEITDSKSSYTNSAGKTYSDVIEVKASYSDSVVTPHSVRYYSSPSYWYSINWSEFIKLTANISIYFAKGFGIVDAIVNQFDATERYTEVDTVYDYYSNPPLQIHHYAGYLRAIASAKCGRTDPPSARVTQKMGQNPTVGLDIRKAPIEIRLFDLFFPKHTPHFQRLGINH